MQQLREFYYHRFSVSNVLAMLLGLYFLVKYFSY
jgi:hypothetical protein